MTAELIAVPPPEHGIYRLAWRSSSVFAPPPWERADPDDGTFHNRFDDPGARLGIGPDQRFRMVYCATERICTLMESCARFRPSLSMRALLADVVEDHPEIAREERSEAFAKREEAMILAEWRFDHLIGYTRLDPRLRFVDIAAMSTLGHLREAMATDLVELGLRDLDLSVVTGPQRMLTQRIARYVYEQVDRDGTPRIAGIRYLSRFGDAQECWAVFDTRMAMRGTVIEQSILPNDPDLLAVAHAFGLTVEVLDGDDLRP